MTMGIDSSATLTDANVKTLKGHGVTHIGRYLGKKTHNWWKCMGPDEANIIKSNDVQIISIWEGDPTSVSKFTHEQGVLDATQAIEEAQYVGQPEGSAIIFTVDYDAQDVDLPAIKTYFAAVRSVLGNKYRMGVYGSYRVIESVDADVYIQTVAWSNGQISSKANVYQKQDDTTLSGIAVDIDEIISDCGAWPVTQHTYQTIRAEVNEKPFMAIIVGKDTYVIWTALNEFKTPNKYLGNGLFDVNGTKIQGVIYNGDTYLPWNKLALPHIVIANELSNPYGFNFTLEPEFHYNVVVGWFTNETDAKAASDAITKQFKWGNWIVKEKN